MAQPSSPATSTNLDPLAGIEADRLAAQEALEARYAAAIQQRKAEIAKLVDRLELFRLDDTVILGALRPALEASAAKNSAALAKLAAAGAEFRGQAGIAGGRRGRPPGKSPEPRSGNTGSPGAAPRPSDPGQPKPAAEAGSRPASS